MAGKQHSLLLNIVNKLGLNGPAFTSVKTEWERALKRKTKTGALKEHRTPKAEARALRTEKLPGRQHEERGLCRKDRRQLHQRALVTTVTPVPNLNRPKVRLRNLLVHNIRSRRCPLRLPAPLQNGALSVRNTLKLPLQRAVPPVLNAVVSPAGEKVRNLRPLVPPQLLVLDQDVVLLLGPRLVKQVGVKRVHPPLTALLTKAPGQVRRKKRPVLRTVRAHPLDDERVLLLSPRPLDQLGVQNLVPSVRDLLRRLPGKVPRNLVPVHVAPRRNKLRKKRVVRHRPRRGRLLLTLVRPHSRRV